jgi:hypothetical protein
VICGVVQQSIMAFEDERNTGFALVPLAGIVALVTLLISLVAARKRTARAVNWTSAALLLFGLVFSVAIYAAGASSLSPGIGGNIGYLVALLVDFYFILPAACAVPIHWALLRGAGASSIAPK